VAEGALLGGQPHQGLNPDKGLSKAFPFPRRRLAARKGHFMNPSLLHSQFETPEPPEDALVVDIAPPPEVIAGQIRRELGL